MTTNHSARIQASPLVRPIALALLAATAACSANSGIIPMKQGSYVDSRDDSREHVARIERRTSLR